MILLTHHTLSNASISLSCSPARSLTKFSYNCMAITVFQGTIQSQRLFIVGLNSTAQFSIGQPLDSNSRKHDRQRSPFHQGSRRYYSDARAEFSSVSVLTSNGNFPAARKAIEPRESSFDHNFIQE